MSHSSDYERFVEKFKPKKTTDDCYTPQHLYDAIAHWVEKEYDVNRESFVRPFYPGGDYENYPYKPGDIVVDNPPFSIYARIVKFYIERGIKFFLFMPRLTAFGLKEQTISQLCIIIVGRSITYENGADVATSFSTNLEAPGVRTAPDLCCIVVEANAKTNKKPEPPKYSYPNNVLTVSKVASLGDYAGMKIPMSDLKQVRALDAQKPHRKGIYGSGFLMSPRAQAIFEKAQHTAQELRQENEIRRAQEKEIRIAQENESRIVWELSEREHNIIASLNTT